MSEPADDTLTSIPTLEADDFCACVYLDDERVRHDALQWARELFGDGTEQFGMFIAHLSSEILACLNSELPPLGSAAVQGDERDELIVCYFNDSQPADVMLDVWNNALSRMGYDRQYRGIAPSRLAISRKRVQRRAEGSTRIQT